MYFLKHSELNESGYLDCKFFKPSCRDEVDLIITSIGDEDILKDCVIKS